MAVILPVTNLDAIALSKLRIGRLKTTVQHGEIRKCLLMKTLKDLGIDRENF